MIGAKCPRPVRHQLLQLGYRPKVVTCKLTHIGQAVAIAEDIRVVRPLQTRPVTDEIFVQLDCPRVVARGFAGKCEVRPGEQGGRMVVALDTPAVLQ